MSPKPKSLSIEERRSRLERRANLIRSRLLRTIDQLDHRRHQVQEVGHQVKRLAFPLGAAIVGLVALTAGTALAVRALAHQRRSRRLGYRVSQALAPLRQERRLPFWREALRQAALTALVRLASELTKRGARRLVVGPPPPSPPLLGSRIP